MNRFFAILIVGLLPTALVAQSSAGSIQGTVVDSSTKSPVAAARVMLLGAHLEELSHTDGKFHFGKVAPGRHSVRVERLGYATVTIEAVVGGNAATQLRIELKPSAVEIAPLMVTGTMTRRRAEEMLSTTTAMHAQQLDRNANPTIAQMIEKQPGVSVSSVGPATARPVIRGLGGDRILLLEDGQRPGDMSASSGDHAVAIEPLTASQIEVVRGPMSLLYGSSAMGGVVNVVKHDIPEALPEHPYGQASFEAASAQPGAAIGGSIVTGLGRFATRFEGSGRLAGNVRTPIGSLENTNLNAYNAALGVGRGGEWGHAGGAYRFYTNHYGIPSDEHEHADGETREDGVDIKMTRHTLRGETEFHREGGLLSSVKLNAMGSIYEHTELEGDGSIGTEFLQRTGSFEAATRIEDESKVNAAFGVRGQFRDIKTAGELNTPSTRDYTLAGYAVSEFGGGGTRYQAGVRYDWAHYEPREETFIFVGGEFVPTHARAFGSFSGSVGMLHELSEKVRIGANLSRAYRTPDFNELYSNGPHLAAHSIDVGDPNLDQETGIGADVFIRRTGEHVRFELSGFVMWLDNYIFPSSRGRAELATGGERPRFQHTNEDARFLGGEAEFALQLAHHWALEANASYVAAEFTADLDSIPVFEGTDTTFIAASKYPPLIPPFNGMAALRYTVGRRNASVEVKWAADATRLGDFETKTAGYAILNFNAGVQVMLAGRLHSFTARVDNVLDTEYRNHLSRIKDIMPEPGRNFALMYRVTI